MNVIESKYPLVIGAGNPDAEKMIALPIPAAALDHGLHFNSTPLGRECEKLTYFMTQMCYDRFSRKRKPKPPAKKKGASGNVDVTPHPTTFRDGNEEDEDDDEDDEDDEDDDEEDEDEDRLDAADEARDHARDLALPGHGDANNDVAEVEADETGDDAYEILMTHGDRKCRKVRVFVETVVHGKGIIAGYVLWFAFYEKGLFNRMFLSMLGYNQAFCSQNAPALQKMRAKPADYDIATRCSIEINSVTSFKDCVLRITSGKIALPEMQLTNRDLIKASCPYNPSVLFCHANLDRFFGTSWNFSPGPINMPRGDPEARPRYPWFIMEVPDSLFERPYEFADVPVDTVLRDEVMSILRPTNGEISAAQRDEIATLVASMPNLLQQRIGVEINKLLEQRDYVYRMSNIVKEMRVRGSTDEDVEQFFRERFSTIHHELFRRPGSVNISEAEFCALRDAPSFLLPRATDAPLFPPRSAMDLRSDVLRQFIETLIRHLFMHKGDRITQAMTVFLSSLPCDVAYTMDESVVGLFGEKETGKSMSLLLREHLTYDKRVKRMDSVTPKTFEINDNFNNHVMLFDEVNGSVIGIDMNASAGKQGAATSSNLVNAQKQIMTGGYHRGSFYAGDGSDRTVRSMSEYLLCASASYIYSQNMRMNIVHMSPLISRFCLFHNQYVAKMFLDPDSQSNNDSGLTRDIEACVGPYGQRFIEFAKKIDFIMLLYCIYVKMGAFALMDTAFARCVMNAMNDKLHAKRMRRYSTRLGDRLRTVIRRTDIWLSILTLFSTGLFHVLLPNKTHMDYDCLKLIDRYVHANGCSVQAIAYVLTLFSTEIIMDTNRIVQDALKALYDENNERFTPAEGDAAYFKPPFRSKHAMAEWLTEATGINANDAPNALFMLTKPTPRGGNTSDLYRPLCYAESHIAAFLVHRDFLLSKSGPSPRDDFVAILHQCMCLERSTPQIVLTSFNHTHAISPNHSVVLGGVHHCLRIEPVRGRYLELRKHNDDADDVDHPTLIEFVPDDFIGEVRDPALHNRSMLSREQQAALPAYPEDFAYVYYTRHMERLREKAFLAEAVHCVPDYRVSADIMLLDEVSARNTLNQRIARYFPTSSDPAAIAKLFVLQTEWYRLLYRQWKSSLYCLRWIEYAVRRPRPTDDFSEVIADIEMELTDAQKDMSHAVTSELYTELAAARAAVAEQVGTGAMSAIFGTLAPTFADAIPLPPWYPLIQADIVYQTYRSSFPSASFIEPLRHLGTSDERKTIADMEALAQVVLKRQTPNQTYVAMPTTSLVAAYDPRKSTNEHLLRPSTLAFWSRQRGEIGAALLARFHETRIAWCRMRHAYAVMMEYKMVCILYTGMKNSLYARVAYDRAMALHAALIAEETPTFAPLPAVTPSGGSAAPPDAAVTVVPPPVDWPYAAMVDVFRQMCESFNACRDVFGGMVWEKILRDDSVTVIRSTRSIRDVVADEIRTEIYFDYASLFDTYLRTPEDVASDAVHAALFQTPLMKTEHLKFALIDETAVRSSALLDSDAPSVAKRFAAANVDAVSERARCKRRMLVFQQ